MKAIVSVILLGLVASVAMAQDQAPPPQPTMFMGHQLGETIQQWFRASDEPKRCAEWNRRKIDNVHFCDVANKIAQGKPGYLNTAHPGGNVLARDRWYFDNGVLAALVANALPYNETTLQLQERYGAETKDQTFTVEHVLGKDYSISSHTWVMPDGTFILIGEDQTAVRYSKLLISTRAYIRKEIDANNPF
jgi:hypothetical protein